MNIRRIALIYHASISCCGSFCECIMKCCCCRRTEAELILPQAVAEPGARPDFQVFAQAVAELRYNPNAPLNPQLEAALERDKIEQEKKIQDAIKTIEESKPIVEAQVAKSQQLISEILNSTDSTEAKEDLKSMQKAIEDDYYKADGIIQDAYHNAKCACDTLEIAWRSSAPEKLEPFSVILKEMKNLRDEFAQKFADSYVMIEKKFKS